MTDQARFWQYVEWSPECWTWRGALGKTGYGTFTMSGGRRTNAHRAMWIFRNGPIPENLVICHKCDNPSCVNPAHLFIGTQGDNMADMFAKGRRSALPHPLGEANHNSVLSREKVLKIRALRAAGKSLKEVATIFGIAGTTVSAVANRKIWKHVA